MNSISGHYIELDGLKIHYEKVGTGPSVLLLLPGGIGMFNLAWIIDAKFQFNRGTSRSDFSIQLSNDKGLNQKLFTIIAWDPPGYGLSRPPARVYDKEVYKRDADLAAKLMQVSLEIHIPFLWKVCKVFSLLKLLNRIWDLICTQFSVGVTARRRLSWWPSNIRPESTNW